MVSGYELHHGDCLAIMPTLAAGSVQTCVTSPPYYGLRDYGLPPTDWPEVRYSPMAGLPALVIPPMECCLGLEPTAEAYIGHLVLIFRGVREALRDDGTAWINLGDSYGTGTVAARTQGSRGIGSSTQAAQDAVPRVGGMAKQLLGVPWRVAFALQADGWYLRQDIIWAKPNPMPESVTDRCTKAHEYIFLLAKSARYFYDHEAVKEEGAGRRDLGKTTSPARLDQGGPWSNDKGERDEATRNKRSVWTVSTKPYAAAHFATFPPDLIGPCILAGTSERGACPACGAGWARVVERRVALTDGSIAGEGERWRLGGKYAGTAQAESGSYDIRMGPSVSSKTTGWQPSCDCDAGEPVPCVVLDIFAGTSATGEAALTNGRRYIGIEASAFNVQLSHDRLAPIDRERRGEFRPRHGEGEPLHELPLFAEANQ